MLYNKKPSYERLKVFGCLCYISTSKQGSDDKFEARAVPYVFLGYSYGMKAYKVMIVDIHKFCTSRDIVFHEHIFPFSISIEKPLSPTSLDTSLDYFEPPQGIESYESKSPKKTPALDDDIPYINHEAQRVRKSARLHRTLGYLNHYVCIAHTASSCFTTLTNLWLQPPSMPIHYLSSNSQQLRERLDFTEPHTFKQASSHRG